MDIQYFFELFGTLVFAISGALAASEKSDPDLFGVAFLAFLAAIGGGSLRDVLLGNFPLVWVKDEYLLYAIGIGILLSYFFHKFFQRLRVTLMLFDTLGIALFTIVGVEKVLALGFSPVIAAIMGMFSAVMGGVIRDVFIGHIPVILQKEVYATACLAGAVVYLILNYLGIDKGVNAIFSGGLIVSIRLLAIKYDLSLPKLQG